MPQESPETSNFSSIFCGFGSAGWADLDSSITFTYGSICSLIAGIDGLGSSSLVSFCSYGWGVIVAEDSL